MELMYKKVDVTDMVGADEPEDINGYYGSTQYYRKKIKLFPISEEEFLQILMNDYKLEEVMTLIKSIDRFHNGYVTKTELDDILKLTYPDQLNDKDLIPIIKRFSSIQNKILIDYKGFKNWTKAALKKLGYYDK